MRSVHVSVCPLVFRSSTAVPVQGLFEDSAAAEGREVEREPAGTQLAGLNSRLYSSIASEWTGLESDPLRRIIEHLIIKTFEGSLERESGRRGEGGK